jgi:hypothetical protein
VLKKARDDQAIIYAHHGNPFMRAIDGSAYDAAYSEVKQTIDGKEKAKRLSCMQKDEMAAVNVGHQRDERRLHTPIGPDVLYI